MNCTLDNTLMNSKREKFRVEIRKSLHSKTLDDKRFKTFPQSSLDNKENVLFNIFLGDPVNKPSDLFKFIEDNYQANDQDQLLQSLSALNQLIEQWDVGFRTQFIEGSMLGTLKDIVGRGFGKKINREVSSLLYNLTGISSVEAELKDSIQSLLEIFEKLIDSDENLETIANAIYGVSNLAHECQGNAKAALSSSVLRKAVEQFNRLEGKAPLRDCLLCLFFNIIESIENTASLTLQSVNELFEICESLFDRLSFSNKKETETSILSVEALETLAERCEPLLVFEVVEAHDFFLVKVLDQIDRADLQNDQFICPLMAFLANMVALPQIDPSVFIRLGMLDTLKKALGSKSDKVRAAAVEVIGFIPFEYNRSENYESEVMAVFKEDFLEIIKAPICRAKIELINTLSEILGNCDPNDPDVLSFLSEGESPRRILECLSVKDAKLRKKTLELLEEVLIIGANEIARLNLTTNPFALALSQDSAGLSGLEKLQNDENSAISEVASRIFENYLDGL